MSEINGTLEERKVKYDKAINSFNKAIEEGLESLEEFDYDKELIDLVNKENEGKFNTVYMAPTEPDGLMKSNKAMIIIAVVAITTITATVGALTYKPIKKKIKELRAKKLA